MVEHVEALQTSIDGLDEAGHRGRPILESVMGEEAAKVLIILDVVRGGWTEQAEVRRRLNYFSSHFARGIYQRVTATNPGTFGETNNYVQLLRPEMYLDGPNDADWIFRNEIETSRELAVYVDYVKEENHYAWVTPRDTYSSLHWPATITADLVCAISRIGLLTEAGLSIASAEWNGVVVTNEMTFAELFEINSRVTGQIIDRGLYGKNAAQEDFQEVAEHWPFPLFSLDLSKLPVSHEELESARSRAEEAFWRSELGPFDF
ncbi:hypothetical protein OH146_01585 [Salinibacterium sp. SYSU T00001]|uniref:hypothetical protein n=1 Tax=Homoserinimonas sedimenticola TaxID=2986805 RepID=UPI0022369B95|nr:hypothetical protein [Salinibacterium sedimenticola]MCW4384461.1 hypothetical protein [Salinibacterium sedimenticola]